MPLVSPKFKLFLILISDSESDSDSNSRFQFRVPNHDGDHYDDSEGRHDRPYARAGEYSHSPGREGGHRRRVESKKPRSDTITGDKRVFQDAKRTVEVHLIKGLPHADGLLVARLPKENVLAYGDMFNLPADAPVPTPSS